MKEVWNNLQLYYPCKRRSWKKWWKAFGRRTLRSSLEKGRKRPAAFFLAAALYQVLIQKWKQPKIKGWSFLKHTLIAGVLPFQKKKVQNFIFIFCLQSSQLFYPLPRPTEWRPMTFTHSSLLQLPTPRGRTDSWISTRVGWSYFTRFCPFWMQKQKRNALSVEWNSFWHGLHVLKRKEVKLRFLTLEEKLLCEENFSLHYSWQAS